MSSANATAGRDRPAALAGRSRAPVVASIYQLDWRSCAARPRCSSPPTRRAVPTAARAEEAVGMIDADCMASAMGLVCGRLVDRLPSGR